MSRTRLAIGVAVVALVGTVAVFAVLAADGGDSGVGPPPLQASELEAFQAGACPAPYEVLRSGSFDEREIAAAKEGRFDVHGVEVSLMPPVDWSQNPQDAQAFSHALFKFQWIDPLLYAYRKQGDVEALQRAVDLVLDFARANPPDGEAVSDEVWGDKRTGDRGPYLAYVLRAAVCEGLLDREQEELLLQLMRRHAETLADPDNYSPTNHGLFVDIGLTLLARELSSLPESAEWGELGRRRFQKTLLGSVVEDEGFWLEHSAGYQSLVTRTVMRFLEVPGNESARLERLKLRMQDVLGWLREPDGRIPQFGDSDKKEVPPFAEVRARDDHGVRALDDSGLVIAKPTKDTYLAVMDSYFSGAHKHSDALTFDLYDRGRRLITDTGLYHKDKDKNFAFAHAAPAHSVLMVDGEDFPRDGTDAFGSGILGASRGAGLTAILGTNPATERQGVDHQRLFVYEPGRFLTIVDRVRSEEEHRYVRFLQFAPGVDVNEGREGLRLRAPGLRGAVRTNRQGGERVELAKGQMKPMLGLTSPSFRRWVPRTTARLRSKGTNLDLITTITLDGPPLDATLQSWDGRAIVLDVGPAAGRGERERIEVSRRPDRRLEVESSAVSG